MRVMAGATLRPPKLEVRAHARRWCARKNRGYCWMVGGSVREREGRFYVRLRVLAIDPATGASRWRQVEKAAGPSRRGALELLRTLESSAQDGTYLPSRVTVAELGCRWLSEHVHVDLKPGAVAEYRATFHRHVLPVLGGMRVQDVRQGTVRMLLDQKREEGLSETTVAKIRRHLHAMFAFGQDAGLVSLNPADVPRRRGRRGRGRRARGTELSPAQVKRLLDECPPRWRAFFTVALDTGMRRGELIGLRWGDVDLLERVIHVRRSIGAHDRLEAFAAGEEELLTTKTQAGQRLLPILDGAQQALEELCASGADTSDGAPVFTAVRPARAAEGPPCPLGRPLDPRMVTRVFRRYADRAGLPGTIRLHDLRHTAITGAIAQGEDILLIAALAGHAKPSTTVNVYGHLMPGRVRDAARRIHSVAGLPAPTPAIAEEPYSSSTSAGWA